MSQVDVEQRSTLADFQLLAEISQLLTLVDLDNVLARVIELSARAVGATSASLFLHYQHSESWQRLLTSRELDPQETLKVVASVLDEGLAGWVVRHHQGTIVYDTLEDERWHVFADDVNPVRSALCLPLMHNDQVLAVITLVHPEPHHFNDHHLRLLTIVMNQVSVAVRNAQLFDRMLEQQRQLEAMLQAIPDVLLVIGEDGNIVLVNDNAVALFGAEDQGDVVGQPLSTLLQLDTAFAPLKSLIDNSPPRDDGWTFETRSDRYRQDFVVTVSRWTNPLGSTAGHVIVMHDVTMLRDLNRFKGEMLKMASHDLRSPLALIVGYCDLIGMDTEDPQSPIFEYLDVVRRSTRRMSNLLDDLLRVEEIRSSPDELQKQVNFEQLVEGVVDNAQMLASAKEQVVSTDIQLTGLNDIQLDPVLIREAMDNLASNAVKYTREGGHILIKSYYDNRHVYFVVEDNGLGIPAMDVGRVFEWGFRARHQVDTPIDGKGLGLSLVKSVLERHRGEVWVESEEGVGSRFGFWLPR